MIFIIKHFAYFGLLYVVFTFAEYFVHRYLMHGSKNKWNPLSTSHWTHHEHTLNDMNLKKSDKYNSEIDKHLGLYFVWKYTAAIFIVGLLPAYLLNLFLHLIGVGIEPRFIPIYVGGFALYQSSFWNTVHPDIHNVYDELSWSEGVPGSNIWRLLYSGIKISDSMTMYEWFMHNHKLHHLRKGVKKGNYNVTLPGADWALGTMYSSASE